MLEYGIDRVGEMHFMCDIVEPDIAIFTHITENHIENFSNIDTYVAEKHALARRTVKKDAIVITNNDDCYQDSLISSEAYGISDDSDLRIHSIEESIKGI